MTISASALTSAQDTTDATSYTTASIAPTADRLILAFVGSGVSAGTANTPTLSGAGMTWVLVKNQGTAAAAARGVTCLRAMEASPGSGTVTIDFAGQTQTECHWAFLEVDGMDTSGSDGEGAIITARGDFNGTSVTSSLIVHEGFTDTTNNAAFSGIMHGGSTGATVGSGFTELTDTFGAGGGQFSTQTQWKIGEDLGVDNSWTGASHWTGVSVEVRASGSATYTIDEFALVGSSSTTDASSIATASITPTANRLVLAAIGSKLGSATPNTPTASGNSLTWVQVATVTYDTIATPRSRLTVFRAMGASPSAGALTFDFGGQTQNSYAWSVIEFGDVDTTGTNGSGAVVQSVTNNADATTTPSVTLAAFGHVQNGTYGVFAKDLNTANTQATNLNGFLIQHDNGIATPAIQVTSEWRHTNDTSVTLTLPASADAAGIAVEVKAASSAVDATVNPAVLTAAFAIAQATASGSSDATASPAVLGVSLVPQNPGAQASSSVTPAVVARSITIPQAVASGGGSATAFPDVMARSITIAQASPQAGASVTPAVMARSITIPQAVAGAGTTVNPALMSRSILIPQATASGSGNATVNPDVMARLIVIPQSGVSAGSRVNPGLLAALMTFPQATTDDGSFVHPRGPVGARVTTGASGAVVVTGPVDAEGA